MPPKCLLLSNLIAAVKLFGGYQKSVIGTGQLPVVNDLQRVTKKNMCAQSVSLDK